MPPEIDLTYADELQAALEAAEEWPPPWERSIWADCARYAAFREADADALRPGDWSKDEKNERPYLAAALPGRIAGAKADLVFGEDAEITPLSSNERSTEGLVEENRLPSRLQFAEKLAASEGEVWWKCYADDVAAYACVQFVSRCYVIPLLRGDRVLAAAFCSTLPKLEDDGDQIVWRHIEIRSTGYVRNLLYKTSEGKKGLGDSEELTAHPETADLPEEWEHGLPTMLCGRVLNTEGTDPAVGVSDFQTVEGLLYALNEVITIGQENVRLTGKKRIVVPQRFLDEQGNFPAGADVIVATEVDTDPDKAAAGLAVVEFEFDAAALIAWKSDLKDEILEGTRTAPQLLGRHTEDAQTGPALRARLIDSVLDAHGKGRYWDAALPVIFTDLMQLDSLPVDQGGHGGKWTRPEEAPSIERQSIIPEDVADKAVRLATEVGSLITSRKTAIRELHPDWDDAEVDAELAEIDRENPAPELPV